MINGPTWEIWSARSLKPHFPSSMNVCTTQIQRVIQMNALIKSAPPTTSTTRKIHSTIRRFAMSDSVTSAGCTLSWIRLCNSISQPHQIKNNGTKSKRRYVDWTKQVPGSQQSAFPNRCPQKTQATVFGRDSTKITAFEFINENGNQLPFSLQ